MTAQSDKPTRQVNRFQMYRDAFEAPCEDEDKGLDRWKIGHRLESRWVAQ